MGLTILPYRDRKARSWAATFLTLAWAVVFNLATACERGCPMSPPASATAAPAAASSAPSAPDAQAPTAPTRPWLESGTAAGLEYVEMVTAGAERDHPLPLIVAIHGLGDDPAHFSDLLRDFPRPARVILPRAIDPYEGGGWSWFPLRARDEDVEGLARGITHAAQRIAMAIDELQTARPTVGRPVVTGFSQGGMLAFALAASHPELVSAAVPVGGWLPPPLWPERSTQESPIIVALHGRADPAVRFQPTEAAIEHLRTLGFDVRLRAYEGVEHVITPDMRRDLFAELAQVLPKAPSPPP